MLWSGREAKDDANWRVSDDYKQAFQCALRLDDGDTQGTERLMSWLEQRTEVLVEQHWPQIHKLAFALPEDDQLDGEAVKRVIEKSGALALLQ